MNNIWDYIDGTLDPDEAKALKEQIQNDPALKAEWEERVRLNQALADIEPDQPSMRFAQNIMDKLPDLYGRREIKPLVSKYGLWAFWATFGLSLVGFIVILVEAGVKNPAASRVQSMTKALLSLPLEFMMILAAVSLGFVLLYLLDQQFKKRLAIEK